MSGSRLAHTLTLPQLVFYGVGSMVGAGIYSVIGAAAGEAGSYLWVSFLAAGCVALLTVLSYAELSARFPKAGAEYQYLKTAFPAQRFLAFFAGYLICVSAAATSATVSLAFAGYADVFMDLPELPTALGLLMLCTLINMWGIQQSTWVSITLISIEVLGLVAVIAAAFLSEPPAASAADGDVSFTGVAVATSLIFFVFMGFEEVANLSEEAKEPKTAVPRALITCVVVTTALYLMVGFAATHLASPQELSSSNAPLSLAAGKASPVFVPGLAVAALFATASTALISLVSISRMLFGMARDGAMPKPLSATWSARKTPWAAALVLFGAACALLPLGEVKTIASVSSFSVLLVFIGVQAALIGLRLRDGKPSAGFRVPLSVGRIPLPAVVGMFAAGALLTRFPTDVYIAGALVIVIGCGLFLLVRHVRTR
ncbi:MAG: APC family permease [Rhodospirillaceae bacterium]